MAKDTVIAVNHVNKDFKLPHQKLGSIKNGFTSMFSMGNRSFEVQHALKDIDFTVQKGEFFGIVGRNGSGKSTLLKILAGIYQPTKGSVKVDGRVVPFIELGVGFNGDLTGRENVYLNGALLGFSEKEINDKYRDIVDFAELERFMDQKLKNYSSGMQVRLAFSVATRLAESDVLLIDEVLAVGDADFQGKCFNYFRELKRQKKTVVFVTHDMGAVREYCDRAVLIDSSQIITIGEPEKIADEYIKVVTKQETVSSSLQDQNEDNDIMITDPEIVGSKGTYRVSYTIKAKVDAEVVAGFKVRHGTGLALFGTNTKIQKKKLVLKASESTEIEWTFSDVLSDGVYYIDLAVADKDAIQMLVSVDEAFTINHNSTIHTPYPVTPNMGLLIDGKA